MNTIVNQITEKAYAYVKETLVDEPEHSYAAISILTDYLYGAFDTFNMLNDNKLDYEDIINIVEGYNAIN